MSEADADGQAGPKGYFDDLFWTPVIGRYAQLIASRIAKDQCGCGLWGLQRVGKSHFGIFLEKSLPDLFGGRLIAVRFDFLGQFFTKPEDFLKRALSDLGVRAITGREREPLRMKLLGAIQDRYLPDTKRVLLIWDEIQNAKEEVWGEIMYIEERVRRHGRTPYTLCIGQPELQNTINLVEQEGHLQAIGRMFQTADEFRGLTMDEVEEFLVDLDGPDHSFTRKHFPVRFSAGWTIQRLIVPIKEAVDSLANWTGLNRVLLLPASTLRQTLNALFSLLDDPECTTREVGMADVLEAFKDNGFKRLFMAYSHALPAVGEGGAA